MTETNTMHKILSRKERRLKNFKKALKIPWYYVWFIFAIVLIVASILLTCGFLINFNTPIVFGDLSSVNLNLLTGETSDSLFEVRNIIVAQQAANPTANYLMIWNLAVSGFAFFMASVVFLFIYQISFFIYSNTKGVNPLDIFE